MQEAAEPKQNHLEHNHGWAGGSPDAVLKVLRAGFLRLPPLMRPVQALRAVGKQTLSVASSAAGDSSECAIPHLVVPDLAAMVEQQLRQIREVAAHSVFQRRPLQNRTSNLLNAPSGTIKFRKIKAARGGSPAASSMLQEMSLLHGNWFS